MNFEDLREYVKKQDKSKEPYTDLNWKILKPHLYSIANDGIQIKNSVEKIKRFYEWQIANSEEDLPTDLKYERKPFVIVKGKNPYFVVFDQKSRLLANQNNQNEYFRFPVIWRRLNLELLPKEKEYTNGLI